MVATVVTKAELICSSMVVAPVSVIFGAIAFFFSLTYYLIVGCLEVPVTDSTKLALKSLGSTMAA